MRHKRLWSAFLVAGAALVFAVTSWAGGGKWRKPKIIELDEAVIRIEINATDGDAGIQAQVDGEPWKRLFIIAPNCRRVLDVRAKGSLRTQGLNEFFFESSEPPFDELPLDLLLKRFPAGTYKVVGWTIEGDILVGEAELTHDIPDQPEITEPEDGGTLDPEDAVIRWNPVTTPAGIQIVGYQVIVEVEEPLRVFTIDMPAEATQVTVPEEFFEGDFDEIKVEVLAREESGNQTITEHEIELED